MTAWLNERAARPGRVLVVAAVGGLPVAHVLTSSSRQFQDPGSEYERANAVIARASGQSGYFGVNVLLEGAVRSAASVAGRRATRFVASLLCRQRGCQRLLDFPASGWRGLVSRDGRETVVLAAFASPGDSVAAVSRVRSALASPSARARLAGLRVLLGGPDVSFSELDRRTITDLQRVELFAFPLLLLLSLWVFRGLVAALLPLLVGGFAVVLAFLALRFIDQVTGPSLSVFALNVVSGLGLGLGIDYSLLILSRYRDELAVGLEPSAAMARVLRTAGRTVLISCLTVATALSSLLVFPLSFLYSLGIGAAVTALAAGVVSLLVLPAVLVALGRRVDALAPVWLQRRAQPPGDGRVWGALARGVTRRPLLVAVLTTSVLLIAAAPVLQLRLVAPSARLLPASAPSRHVEGALARDFAADPAASIYTVYHAAAGFHTSAGPARRFALEAARLARGQAEELPLRYLGGGGWEVGLAPYGSPYSSSNQRLVVALRAFAHRRGALVGGLTAYFIDQRKAIAESAWLALAILALVSAGFLFSMTGSLVIALKALAMNVVTAVVSAGLLVAIFQDGLLSGLLGFAPIGGLEEANLVFLLVIAFALSTDYEVFLLARIKEERDQGLSNSEAIVAGLERTGQPITAAALLFCVAVGAFAASQLFFVKQFGVGAALAVAVDATAVRVLLVPSLMALLGEKNWWAPAPLRRLHERMSMKPTGRSRVCAQSTQCCDGGG